MNSNFKKVVYRGVPYFAENRPTLRRKIVEIVYRGIKSKTEINSNPIAKVIK